MNRYDSWLAVDGPVAVTLKEPLEAVEGAAGIIFPPTFAPFEKEPAPNYVIDETGEGKTALVDSVGSQANRMEPIFKEPPYAALVPRALVKIGARQIDLLDAGHRAADAVVRFSSKRKELADAFRELADSGNATKMAKLAPTSLVFGVWDSRGTGVKVPRLVGSTVRAFGVERLTRAAQFFSALEKEETESFGQNQDFLSGEGLSDAPAGRTLGGVIARKGIVREALLNLVALRSIAAPGAEEARKLQRYVLGFALVALTAPFKGYLRQGCLLVTATKEKPDQKLVRRDGAREPLSLDAKQALAYAEIVTKDFGVGPGWEATFERGAVDEAAAAAKAKKAKAKKGA